jgi:transcriptional regulator with XRE-family HTH domain
MKIEGTNHLAAGDIIGDFMRTIPAAVIRAIHLKMEVAAYIADALTQQKLTQKEFAQKLGKKPSEISKWLSGKQNFTLETLCLIEDALGVDLIHISSQPIIGESMPVARPAAKERVWKLPFRAPVGSTFSHLSSQAIMVHHDSLQPLPSNESHLQPC